MKDRHNYLIEVEGSEISIEDKQFDMLTKCLLELRAKYKTKSTYQYKTEDGEEVQIVSTTAEVDLDTICVVLKMTL